MADYQVGDEVVTVRGLWHHGEDVGERLGKVIDVRGHIIIDLHNYHDNPVKCFRNEIRRARFNDKEYGREVSDMLDLFLSHK